MTISEIERKLLQISNETKDYGVPLPPLPPPPVMRRRSSDMELEEDELPQQKLGARLRKRSSSIEDSRSKKSGISRGESLEQNPGFKRINSSKTSTKSKFQPISNQSPENVLGLPYKSDMELEDDESPLRLATFQKDLESKKSSQNDAMFSHKTPAKGDSLRKKQSSVHYRRSRSLSNDSRNGKRSKRDRSSKENLYNRPSEERSTENSRHKKRSKSRSRDRKHSRSKSNERRRSRSRSRGHENNRRKKRSSNSTSGDNDTSDRQKRSHSQSRDRNKSSPKLDELKKSEQREQTRFGSKPRDDTPIKKAQEKTPNPKDRNRSRSDSVTSKRSKSRERRRSRSRDQRRNKSKSREKRRKSSKRRDRSVSSEHKTRTKRRSAKSSRRRDRSSSSENSFHEKKREKQGKKSRDRKNSRERKSSRSKSPEKKYRDNYKDFEQVLYKVESPASKTKKDEEDLRSKIDNVQKNTRSMTVLERLGKEFIQSRKELEKINKALSPKIHTIKHLEPIKITIGASLNQKKTVQVENTEGDTKENFGPPLPSENKTPEKIVLKNDKIPSSPLAESTPAPKSKPRSKTNSTFGDLDMFDSKQDIFDNFGANKTSSSADSDTLVNKQKKTESAKELRITQSNPLTGTPITAPKSRRSRFSDRALTPEKEPLKEQPASSDEPNKRLQKSSNERSSSQEESPKLPEEPPPNVPPEPSPVPPPTPRVSTGKAKKDNGLKKSNDPLKDDSSSSSSSSSSSDSSSDSSSSDEERKRKNNAAKVNSPDGAIKPGSSGAPTESAAMVPPIQPAAANTSASGASLSVSPAPGITSLEEFSFLDPDDESGEDNYDPENCIHSDSVEENEEKEDINIYAGLGVTEESILVEQPVTVDSSQEPVEEKSENKGESDSSMAMSPVTPPTEDEEKTLCIDTGSPQPEKQQDNLEAQQHRQSIEIIKPQAVVPPMNSDTSPLSSEERNLLSSQTVVVSTTCNLTPMQSVLTTSLPTLTSDQPPMQTAHPVVTALSSVAPQAAPPLTALPTNLFSIAHPARLPPEPVPTQSIQAEMVLRNLAEIGKQIGQSSFIQSISNNMLNPTLPTVGAKSSSPETPDDDIEEVLERRRDRKSRKSLKSTSKKPIFKKRRDFQRAVIDTAKDSIKPFYKNRRIDKHEYKKIMRDLVRKVVTSSKTYSLDKEKIARLVEKYVSRYSSNAPPNDRKKKKEEMLGFFNEKEKKKLSSDSSPEDSITDIIESAGRPVLTIPQLPLPPPPPKQPPPRQFGKSRSQY